MTTRSDLVLPKLGLTMTEGTVAHWVVAPGVAFAAGDIVAVVETDKIAYEVEAPADGVMHDHLVPEGTLAAVGTPIAQWELTGGPVSNSARAPAPTAAEHAAPAQAGPSHQASPLSPAPSADGARILSTPYARRLAREAGIDLAALQPADSRRRIKAADVMQAVAARDAGVPAPSAAPAAPGTAAETVPALAAAGVAFFGIEVDAAAVERLTGEIARDATPLRPAFIHFAAIAAARALNDVPLAGGSALLGIQTDDGIAALDAEALRRLSRLVAAMEQPGPPVPAGTLAIMHAADLSFMAVPPPPGWLVCLSLGALRRVFEPDADGRPVVAVRVQLVLSTRAEVAPVAARALLGRIRALLENPLPLLVS